LLRDNDPIYGAEDPLPTKIEIHQCQAEAVQELAPKPKQDKIFGMNAS